MTRASEPLTDEQLRIVRAWAQTGDLFARAVTREIVLRLLTEHAAQAERVRELEEQISALKVDQEHLQSVAYHTRGWLSGSSTWLQASAALQDLDNYRAAAAAQKQAHDAHARAKGDANG